MVNFDRKISPCKVLKDGKCVGDIQPTLTKTRWYILHLKGKYWRANGELTTKGGRISKNFKTLAEAKEYAIKNA